MAAFLCLVDRVGLYQLRSFQECSYAPLARAIPQMLTEENLHIGMGRNLLNRIANDPTYYGAHDAAQRMVDKWYPRALDMFGHTGSSGSETAVALGIKRWCNEEARAMYIEEVKPILEKMNLRIPDPTSNRRILEWLCHPERGSRAVGAPPVGARAQRAAWPGAGTGPAPKDHGFRLRPNTGAPTRETSRCRDRRWAYR